MLSGAYVAARRCHTLMMLMILATLSTATERKPAGSVERSRRRTRGVAGTARRLANLLTFYSHIRRLARGGAPSEGLSVCLVVDHATTDACREQLCAEGGSRTVYKVLQVEPVDLRLTSAAFQHVWRPGWHEAVGEFPCALVDGMEIGAGGFHVYFDRPEDPRAIPFRAFERDFLCAGGGGVPTHALFRRLYLDAADYEQGRKRLLEWLRHEHDQPVARRLRTFIWRIIWGNAAKIARAQPDEEIRRLDKEIRRCGIRCARIQRRRSGSRLLTEPEWDVVREWINHNVESGRLCRALVDVTACGSESSRGASVWIQEGGSGPSRRRPRSSRAVPLRRVFGDPIAARDIGPLSAA